MPDDPNSLALYHNKSGLGNRITSVRIPISLRDSLMDYAISVKRSPSSIIRQAIAEYLRARKAESPKKYIKEKMHNWTAKSTKLKE